MAYSHQSESSRISGFREVLPGLANLVVVVALVAIALAYLIDGMSPPLRTGAAGVEPTLRVEANIAGTDLQIPLSWMQVPEQQGQDFAERLDLKLPIMIAGAERPSMISATLLPRARVRPSAQLLDSVYLQRFDGRQIQDVPGLVGKPLTGGEGFESETLWYDPINANPFVAKCTPMPADETRSICLRTRLAGDGLAVVLSFDSSLLAHWRGFDAALDTTLAEIGIGTEGPSN